MGGDKREKIVGFDLCSTNSATAILRKKPAAFSQEAEQIGIDILEKAHLDNSYPDRAACEGQTQHPLYRTKDS